MLPRLGEEVEGRRLLALAVRATSHLPAASRDPPLTVARTTNCGKVAGGIAQRVRQDGCAVLRCAGAVALRQALKATALAHGYLVESEGHAGDGLAALAKFREPEGDEAGLPAECEFTLFRLPSEPSRAT
mmetsp:Transcript_95045/g.264089  ORF Transcript_95045/g.264089 Transcript_95045/m.264089 type:complete len:130 (+) Transcript_95045:838-1227(+)